MVFADLFRELLPRGGSAFEIGCYPGKFLIWLSLELGYTVSGVDLTPRVEVLPKYMRSLGVKVGTITRGDAFAVPAAPEHDLVCSFGFVEHFENYPDVLRRHSEFLRPGGWLVISCPNFRRGQHVLHTLLDAQNMRRHHLPAMSFDAWRGALEPAGFEIVRTAYVGTCEFWAESEGALKMESGGARLGGWRAHRAPDRAGRASPELVVLAVHGDVR